MPYPNDIYDEIGEICEFMPDNHRQLFCFRWGLCGHFPHTVKQTAAKFEMKPGSVEYRLERCLSNIARHARQHDLPALQALLGDLDQWTEHAWKLAGRWGNQESQFAEAVMLLALAGLDVSEGRGAVRQHMVELGLARTAGRRHSRQRSASGRHASPSLRSMTTSSGRALSSGSTT